MPAVVRSYVTAGVALMGVGVISAAQIAPSLDRDQTRVVEAAVSLAAAVGAGQPCSGYVTEGCDIWATPTYTPIARDESGSAANIAANILNAVISMPRAFVDALNELSYGLEVTGSWWVYTPTNVLGTDPADPPKETALVNLAIPFKPLSNAIAEQVAWWARANLPMNAGCTGSVGPTCADPLPLLNSMFVAPPWVLTAGYQFPELYNPVSDAEGAVGEPIPDSVGNKVPWSGATVKLDPADPVNAVLNYLFADPATNTPETVTLTEIGATLNRLGKALDLAFNPFVPMSFLLKGWPYTVFTPLVMPLVPLLCPTCNPEDPGLPPVTQRTSASTTVRAHAESSEPSGQSAVLDAGPVPAAVDSAPAAAGQSADPVDLADAVDRADRKAAGPAAAVDTAGPDTAAQDVAAANETAANETAANKTAATEDSPKRATKQRRGMSPATGAADPTEKASE